MSYNNFIQRYADLTKKCMDAMDTRHQHLFRSAKVFRANRVMVKRRRPPCFSLCHEDQLCIALWRQKVNIPANFFVRLTAFVTVVVVIVEQVKPRILGTKQHDGL